MHALRHYYASLLIRHGESVKVVQARLGHASASETLDTYSHLWPDSEDSTRAAVDAVLGEGNDARAIERRQTRVALMHEMVRRFDAPGPSSADADVGQPPMLAVAS